MKGRLRTLVQTSAAAMESLLFVFLCASALFPLEAQAECDRSDDEIGQLSDSFGGSVFLTGGCTVDANSDKNYFDISYENDYSLVKKNGNTGLPFNSTCGMPCQVVTLKLVANLGSDCFDEFIDAHTQYDKDQTATKKAVQKFRDNCVTWWQSGPKLELTKEELEEAKKKSSNWAPMKEDIPELMNGGSARMVSVQVLIAAVFLPLFAFH